MKAPVGSECARCLALGLHLHAARGNVLCSDGQRRDLCEGHWREVKAESGRAAQAKGQDFEEWVERHHEEALRLGIVAGPVEHNEPHWRRVRGRWERVAPGIADYTGVLHDGHGSTLGTEVKSYKDRLPRSEISLKQQQYLDVVVRGGGLALLVVQIAGEGEFAVLWKEVPWIVERSAESVTARELAPWRIEGSCYLERFCKVRGEPAVAGRRVFPRE